MIFQINSYSKLCNSIFKVRLFNFNSVRLDVHVCKYAFLNSNDLNTYKICSTNRCRSRLGGKKLQRYDQVRYAKIELIYLHNTPSLIQGDLSKSKGHLIMQSINSSNSSAARILPQIPCGLKFFDKVLSQTKKFGLSSDHGKISAFRHSILSSML